MSKVKEIKEILLIFFNWYGGKIRFIEDIKKFEPKEYSVLVEPYGGSFSYGLNCRNKKLIYNDINPLLYNLFKVIKDVNTREKLIDKLLKVRFTEEKFDEASIYYDYDFEGLDDIQKAVYTYILIKSSFNGCMTSYSKNSVEKNTDKEKLKQNLLAVAKKVEKTEIYNMTSLDLMKEIKEQYRGREREVFFLIDCPYLASTRGAISVYGKGGEHEMDRYDHIELLEDIIELGKLGFNFILCGKDNDFECLYDYMLEPHGIKKYLMKKLKNNAQCCKEGQSKDDYEEWIWTNIPQTDI